MEKNTCCASVVAGSTGFRTFYKACAKTAKVERDHKWYCGTHDPEAMKARDAARLEKSQAQWAAERKKYADQALGMKALAWMREHAPEKLAEIEGGK